MNPIVAFDETGNTGDNLLDPDQPVFVLASVQLPDEDTVRVLGDPAGEIKFAKLKRSRVGERRILSILNSSLLSADHLQLSGIHKPFMVVAKMVDLLVEPLVHREGINLYERGANIALANMFHFCLPVFLGHEVFEMLKVRFVEMVRTPSPETIDAFYALLEQAFEDHHEEEFAVDLAVLLATRAIAVKDSKIWGDSQLDPSVPAFVQHAYAWTRRLGTRFTIIHDQSKPLINRQILLEAMMSTTDKPMEIGYDRRKVVFPITADGIDFRDSEDVPQLQLADLVAGSAGYCLRATVQGVEDSFSKELLATRALAGDFLPLWPEMKVTPDQLGTAEVGGIDAIDFVAEYVSRRLGGILPGSHIK
ncbi:MAG TPA: DUF3800 domain-containing protein [Thermoleophilia bacterium]|nr:DUF3800 domain-containing protein [Thermoleophilia bacterium]